MLQDAFQLFKKFKYFFDIRGVETHELDNSPDGWPDTIIEYDRSKTYNGLTRNLTLPYKFVKFAAELCRREYAKYLLLARINQRILLGDGRNNYTNVYTGKLDFSTKIDSQTGFTINSKTADFSANIDAYADQKYSFSLQDGVYVELTPITLNETASLLPSPPPDGNIHSDYFVPVQVVNNQQNSVDASVFTTTYQQKRAPDFSNSGDVYFFTSRLDQNLYIKGTLELGLINVGLGNGPQECRIAIYNQNGDFKYEFYHANIPEGITLLTVDINYSMPMVKNERLTLYMQQVGSETPGTGITVKSGQLDLSYQTITPATMCRALTLDQIFGKLLQAMNNNLDSGPNLPVPYQSFLLKGLLKNIVVTSSDSIRASQGSIYRAGDTLFQGIYLVLSGTAHYGDTDYTTGQSFTFQPANPTFSGDGIVEKTTAIYAGVTYNPGDTLQAGGTYLVEGDPIIYNSVEFPVNSTFKYVLGQDTFTGTTSHSFVKQIASDPQIITSLNDLYQTIKSLMWGNVAMGVDKDGTLQGRPFIESLDYAYRAGIKVVDLGIVDKDWKSSPATDLMYNSIKAGFEDQQYDAINGQQEVNSTQYWGSDLLTPVAELDLISKYRGDCIGIETVRVTQQDTAASRSDNDPFMIWIEDTPVSNDPFTYYHPLRTTNITGVDPSFYNWKLSPKHSAGRGGPYLASIFYNMIGYSLKLTGYSKNISLTVTENGMKTIESAPIEIVNLPRPLFIPEYYETTQGVATELISMIDNNPYADLTFTVNGVVAKAFISNLKVDLGKESPQGLKLLLTPDNKLSDFVR